MRRVIMILLPILLISSFSLAQEQTGRIVGRVTADDGKVVEGAQVTISSTALLRPQVMTTDNRGRFRFLVLPVGTYDIKIEKEQYRTFEQTDIAVRIGNTITLEIPLTMGDFEESITITGDAPLVDVKETTVSENLSQDILSRLPNGRDPSELLSLAAGAVKGDMIVSLGATEAVNSFKVDGIDFSDSIGGVQWIVPNFEIVEEVEILPIAGATADIGNFTGAAINMVTKNGGNEFKGGIVWLFFNEDMISWNTDDEAIKGDTTRYSGNNEFSAQIGGPILKDRAWFYVCAGRVTTRNLLDVYEEKTKRNNVMAKVSTAIGDSMHLYSTYMYDDIDQENRGIGYNIAPEATLNQISPSRNFGINFTWVASADDLLELKVSGYDGQNKYTGNGSGPQLYEYESDYTYGNSSGDFGARADRYNMLAKYTRFVQQAMGDHELKMGVEWSRAGNEEYETLDIIELIGGEYDFRLGFDPAWYSRDVVKTLTFYINDSWKITDNLLINVGLRYDRPSFCIPDQIIPGSEVLSGLDELHSFDNFAPRLGFTYTINEDSIIRGSYGRYYENMYAWMFQSFNPLNAIYYESVWTGDSWERIYEEDLGSADLYTLDPDTSGMYVEAFTLGFEQVLLDDVVFSADYVHKSSKNVVVSMEDGKNYEPFDYSYGSYNYTLYNWVDGDPHYTITNADEDLKFDYDGLVLRLDKRYSDNWQLRASLTISHSRGNLENISGWSDGVNSAQIGYYTDPNNRINSDGLSAYHRPINFKLQGTYTLPFDISVSAISYYESGRRWTPTLEILDDDLGQYQVEILAEERGSRALDPVFSLDVRVEKAFRLDRYRLSLFADFFNVLNSGTTTGVVSRLDLDDFGEAVQLMNPRIIQLGFRFSF